MARARADGRRQWKGLDMAKDEGKRLGRPKVDKETEDAIRKALRRKDRPGIAVDVFGPGIGRASVYRALG